MKTQIQQLKPQDIIVLLKIITMADKSWNQIYMAEALGMSQSEISESLSRSKYAGLLDASGKKVSKNAFLEFLQYGLPYIFPQKPGAIVRGISTAHSASPLNEIIDSSENYVWPYAKGNERGQSIFPLYYSVPQAALKDSNLYELLALVDVLRVGRKREKEIAVQELTNRFKIGK